MNSGVSTPRILAYALMRSLASLRRRPMVAALTVGVMTVSLSLVALTHLAERNIHNATSHWGQGVQMIVYLDAGTSDEHAGKLRAALLKLPAVEEVFYVPPEEALKHLEKTLGHQEELLSSLEPNFMPASLEVRLESGVRDLASAHSVIQRLEKTPGVEEVEFLGNWVESMSTLLQRVRRVGLWIVGIMALIGVFTIVATMRLSADSRASEWRVLELMGAPALLSRGPNLIEGVLLGVAGAFCALGLCFLLFNTLQPALVSALQSSLGELPVRFLELRDIAQLFVLGASVGLIGGAVTNYAQERL